MNGSSVVSAGFRDGKEVFFTICWSRQYRAWGALPKVCLTKCILSYDTLIFNRKHQKSKHVTEKPENATWNHLSLVFFILLLNVLG